MLAAQPRVESGANGSTRRVEPLKRERGLSALPSCFLHDAPRLVVSLHRVRMLCPPLFRERGLVRGAVPTTLPWTATTLVRPERNAATVAVVSLDSHGGCP